LLVRAIDRLRQIAPVQVVMVTGNHLNAADALRLGCRIPPTSCEGTLTGRATAATRNSLTDAHASFYTTGNGLGGLPITVEQGTGTGQSNVILFNTTHELTLKYRWDTLPDHTSRYRIIPQIHPRTNEDIAVELFPQADPATARLAAEGLIAALAFARDTGGNSLLSLRVHLFLRNLLGVWACTNPACVPNRTTPSTIGSLHYMPTPICHCGARVLELLYCEACGETFFGGYRRESTNPNEWFLSPDHPNLEAAPELVTQDRDYMSYAVYWPAGPGLSPRSPIWQQDGVQRQWARAELPSASNAYSKPAHSTQQLKSVSRSMPAM
jgi:hypothetical protein